MRRTTRFRQLIDAPEILMLPGAHDALSLKLAEKAGFQAATCGGYSATASLIGQPDVGQLGMSEMAEMYARLCDRTDIPLLADADTGYGGPTNVARMMRAYERAGIAAVFIEDQVSPKRCGHMDGKRVIPANEMVEKLKAALDARIDHDLIVMARTDARAVDGLDAAIERAELYREAGADVLFVEAPRTRDDLARIVSALGGGLPLLANMVEGGKTPTLPAAELDAIGFAVVIFPGAIVRALGYMASEFYGSLATHGSNEPYRNRMLDFSGINELVGTPEMIALGRRYETPAGKKPDAP